MKLNIRDVSKLLNVSEANVTRCIKQRGLPARYVGGQYRFDRLELLEWATANKMQVSLELFDSVDADDDIPSLAAALEAGGISGPLDAADKHEALRGLVQVMPLPSNTDRELVLQLYLAREASASTGVGDGIALPHVRNPVVLHVDAPMVTLCYLKTPIDFGASDGKPVDVFFSLVCPSMRSHLQLLARLSHALHDIRFKELVMRRSPREEILREARRFDAQTLAPLATPKKVAG